MELGGTLVESLAGEIVRQVDAGLLAPGARLPSIRALAAERAVSRFTVVEAYERLVARGRIESRPGSGFYVLARRSAASGPRPAPPRRLDVGWLMRHLMTRELPQEDMPGVGTLPRAWLDDPALHAAVRAVGRGGAGALTDYGDPQGWAPLRGLLQRHLDAQGIRADPLAILCTAGVTQALDLVGQALIRPGDTVLVDTPSYPLMFARYAQLGATVLGVPRLPDGPDTERLRELAARHRPRLLVIHPVLHNPTGGGISAACAYRVLQLASEFDFTVVEDDIYGELHPSPGVRLAALDQLQRVVHLSGFSKTLSAKLRVGYVAAHPDLIGRLSEIKLMVSLGGNELPERVVHQVLEGGGHRRHLQRLRERLDAVRAPALRALARAGCHAPWDAGAGMFGWLDCGRDADAVTRAMLERGFVTAPGGLFTPDRAPSSFLRFNLAHSRNPRMLDALARAIQASPPLEKPSPRRKMGPQS